MILDEVEIVSNRVNPNRYPRPVISTLDTWDQHAQIDYHFNMAMPGRRVSWNIPSIAVTSESVNTIRSSSQTRAQGVRIATKAGFHPDPITNSFGYKPVPNMAQAVKTDSPVEVKFSLIATSSVGSQAPFFAIYRDGVKISQEYRASSTAGINFLVSGSYTDPNPPMGYHVYDLRWHIDPAAPATLTATGKQRTFQVSNLRAQ